MLRHLIRVLVICAIAIMVLAVAAFADDQPASRAIQEEVWAIPVTLPTIAYVVRPVGNGPFPLVVMNHGVSLNQRERGFFPLVEFRDAAMWFARRGYMVGAPAGSGYGFFGPELSKRMHEAYTGAGGNAEYHLLPAFGSDGHFLVTSPDSIPLWAPLVGPFLDKHG
jgi:hypothetical protein